MNIPKTFELCGRTWRVSFLEANGDNEKLSGYCKRDGTILIYNHDAEDEDYRRLTFWHELVHAIFFAQGKEDHDEEEVEGIAQLLHQFHKTAKGEVDLS